MVFFNATSPQKGGKRIYSISKNIVHLLGETEKKIEREMQRQRKKRKRRERERESKLHDINFNPYTFLRDSFLIQKKCL